MAGGTREIKRRIKSIANTKKITKAMEMVAASKMKKAVSSVMATRDYANLAWATVLHLSETTDSEKHILLQKPLKSEKVGLVLIGSNRGLCGGFNIQLVQKAIESIKKHQGRVEKTEVIAFGSKTRDLISSMGYEVAADFEKPDLTLRSDEVAAISSMMIKQFKNKEYDKVFVAYTDYESTIKQVPRVKQLLPIEPDPDEHLGLVGKSQKTGVGADVKFIKEKQEKYLKKDKFTYEYTFEPSAEIVLEKMLPRLIEVQIYQAALESEASEHSARMMAMKNASDAASDMIDDLTLYYNQARQAGITQEISEIAGGAAALEK